MASSSRGDGKTRRESATPVSAASSSTVRSETSSSRQHARSTTPEHDLSGFQFSPEKETWDQEREERQGPAIQISPVRRSHRSGGSGGFLLNPAYSIAHGQSRHQHGKGKDKEERFSASRTENLSRTSHKHGPSIGSSPLATVVTNANSPALDGASPTAANNQSNASRPGSRYSDLVPVIGRDKASQLSSFDADPAQIVNMALNLSESRRRHFSAGYNIPSSTSDGRRIVSAGRLGPPIHLSPRLGDASRAGQTLKRDSPRDTSPRNNRFLLGSNVPLAEPEAENDRDELSAVGPGFYPSIQNDVLFNPSDATLARVEKAREALELRLEYRRLLRYLPKLPTPHTAKSPPAKSSENDKPTDERLGRAYNPLQYIRNRKVRTRERHNFDSEREGWKDVERVKYWIDQVADNRRDGVSRIDDKFPLPPFGIGHDALASPQTIASPSTSLRQMNSLANKPVRPRRDWNFEPWDLLADAYWLDQADHKYLIEDNEGKKLYPQAKQPVETLHRESKDLQRHQPRRSDSIPRQIFSVIKPRSSIDLGKSGEERGRARHQFNNSVTSNHGYSSSADRKSKWARKLKRSHSLSSSDESALGSARNLSQARGSGFSRERQESAVLEKQVMELLAQDNEDIDWEMVKDFQNKLGDSQAGSRLESRKPSTAEDSTEPDMARNWKKAPSPIKIPPKSILPKVQVKTHKSQNSVDEYDSTAPNSPTAESLVPGISINLTPPPTKNSSRSLLPTISRSESKERNRISQTAFAATRRPASNSRLEQIRREATQDVESPTQPSDGLLSPKDAVEIRKGLHRRNSDSKHHSTNGQAKEPSSKLKSLAKVPGKIADRVAHPINRVGDLVRKKDSMDGGRPTISKNFYASDASETDEDLTNSRMNEDISRTTTQTSDSGALAANGDVKYFNKNLPVFRSPFGKRDGTTILPISQDNFPLQQMEQSRVTSERFHRLKPPSLDMRSVSPSPPGSIRRSKSVDSDITVDSQEDHGSDRSERRNSRRHATAGLPTETGLKVPVTGLTSFGSQPHKKHAGASDWTISHRSVSPMNPETHVVTTIDIARVRALLLSSGVKARNISARAHSIRPPEQMEPVLRELQGTLKTPLPRVPRYQEHVLASRLLVTQINDSMAALEIGARELATTTVIQWRRKNKDVEDLITNKLSPAVGMASDQADILNAQLNSKYTLDVKSLDDKITILMRRRRRRFRYLRRGLWKIVEWTVLSVLWFAWLVAVFVRIARGFVRAIFVVVKWLLTI